jgi:hypothetical protein
MARCGAAHCLDPGVDQRIARIPRQSASFMVGHPIEGTTKTLFTSCGILSRAAHHLLLLLDSLPESYLLGSGCFTLC